MVLIKKHPLYFLTLFCIFIQPVIAQQLFLGHNIRFTPKTAPVYNFNEQEYKTKLLEKYKADFKKEEDLNTFCNTLIEGKRYYLTSNTEYESWDTANTYMNSILQKMNLSGFDLPVKIKLIRDPAVNACAFEDGVVYFNIGFIANINTEAEIAAILGHELGHVINKHACENYKARKDYFRSMYLSYHNGSSNTIGALINARKNSNVLVSNEEQSDKFAAEVFQKCEYNIAAFEKVFSMFLNLEKKYKANKAYDAYSNSMLYLNTHPTSESRVLKAKKLSKNGGGTKNFMVDSVYFTRLKQACIDESINMCFENLDYEDCIELAFIEHLKKPLDPFYLFYITECTRRSIAFNKETGNDYFISGRYREYFSKVYKSSRNKVYARTNNSIKPFNESFYNSVFYKLCGPLFNLDSNDYKSFKNKQLLNGDTLLFLTNNDALNYFKNVNTNNSFNLNNKFLGSLCNTTTCEKEKVFCDLPLTPQQVNADKILWVLYNVDHTKYEKKGLSSADVDFISETENTFYSQIKSKGYDNYIYVGNDLYFNEKVTLEKYINLIYPLIKDQKLKELKLPNPIDLLNGSYKPDPEDFITRGEANFNCSSITPELMAILKNHDYKGIVFSEVQISDQTTKQGLGTYSGETWTIKHFYLDSKKEKVKFYMTQWGNGGWQSSSALFSSFNKVVATDLCKGLYESIKDVSR